MSAFVGDYFRNSYKELVTFFAKEQKISAAELQDIIALIRNLNALVEPAGKLLLVGDKEVSLAEFRPLLAAETRQVTALNAQDARQRFGERGRNGAILIAAKP